MQLQKNPVTVSGYKGAVVKIDEIQPVNIRLEMLRKNWVVGK